MSGEMGIDRRQLMVASATGVAGAASFTGAAQAQGLAPASIGSFLHMPPAAWPAAEGMAEIPGTKLYYWDTGGKGPPVVLMHPASGSAMIWAYQQAAFASAGYRVIAYSRRGYAKSQSYDSANPGSGSLDLLAFAQALKLPRFHLVASAAGGSISMDFALSNPDRLLSLTISSNSAGVRDGDIFRAAERIRPAGWDQMPVAFRELGPSYRAANLEGAKLWLDLEHHALTGTQYRQTPVNRITDASLKEVKPPVLLIAGAADLITPPAITRLLQAAIPNCEMAIADETGHSVYWERPDLFNRAVLDFLGRHKG